MKAIYAMKTKDDTADIYLYGDIASGGWGGPDSISAKDVIDQIKGSHAQHINVFIESYGGEVAEGLAIYNALKRSNATVTTYCDGFACSIASVIFMAGKIRKMHKSSLLMIHNAWTVAIGDANELEKQAEDLRKINETVKQSYLGAVTITEDELDKLLDAETWITPDKAVEMGFATEVVDDEPAANGKMSANARKLVFDAIIKAADISIDPDEDPDEDPAEPEEPDDDDDAIEKRFKAIEDRVEALEKEVFDGDDGAHEDDEDADEAPDGNASLQNLLKIFN